MSEINEAQQWKERGNVAFKEKRYNAAIQNYSKSLEYQKDPVVFGNRAQAEINAGLFILAQMDCTAAIELNSKIPKNFYRRAQSLKSLGLLNEAYKDAEKCASLSSDAAVAELKKELENKKNVKLLEVEPFERDELVSSTESFIEIPILFEEEEEEEEEIEEFLEQTSKSNEKEVKILPRQPSNFSDFATDVKYLEERPEMLAQYFLSIENNRYHELFDDLIEDVQASKILKALNEVIQQNSSSELKSQIAQKLIQLSEVERFDLIIMMMGVEDKKTIFSICEKLSTNDSKVVQEKYL